MTPAEDGEQIALAQAWVLGELEKPSLRSPGNAIGKEAPPVAQTWTSSGMMVPNPASTAR
jgi:hypothetical protein